MINAELKVNHTAVTELTDWSSPLAPPGWPSRSGEWSVGASLAWDWGQSEDEVCCGAGVDAACRARKRSGVSAAMLPSRLNSTSVNELQMLTFATRHLHSTPAPHKT